MSLKIWTTAVCQDLHLHVLHLCMHLVRQSKLSSLPNNNITPIPKHPLSIHCVGTAEATCWYYSLRSCCVDFHLRIWAFELKACRLCLLTTACSGATLGLSSQVLARHEMCSPCNQCMVADHSHPGLSRRCQQEFQSWPRYCWDTQHCVNIVIVSLSWCCTHTA